MSELVTTRIGTHAARLGLPHLAAAAPALIQRAHDAQLGYADFLDLILGEEAAAKDDWGAPKLPDSPSIRMDVWKGEVIASTEEELLSRIQR